jgi:hypothetical protein
MSGTAASSRRKIASAEDLKSVVRSLKALAASSIGQYETAVDALADYYRIGIAIGEMIFVGDALFPGGNDYPAKQAGVVSIQVRDPNETKRVVETIIACLADARAV